MTGSGTEMAAGMVVQHRPLAAARHLLGANSDTRLVISSMVRIVRDRGAYGGKPRAVRMMRPIAVVGRPGQSLCSAWGQKLCLSSLWHVLLHDRRDRSCRWWGSRSLSGALSNRYPASCGEEVVPEPSYGHPHEPATSGRMTGKLCCHGKLRKACIC